MALDSGIAPLVDGCGRAVSYLRLSVTDRCDLRCTYCMAEKMKFLPRRQVLSMDEMLYLARVFVDHGVRKIRVTGGEPLVRPDIMDLFRGLAAWRGCGDLDEITLTTNGTQLARHAAALADGACGPVRRRVGGDGDDANDPDRHGRTGCVV